MVTPVLEWNKIKTELYISFKVEKLNLKQFVQLRISFL